MLWHYNFELKKKTELCTEMCSTGEEKESNNKAACWSNSECNHREMKSNMNVEDTHRSRSRRIQNPKQQAARIVLLHVAV